MTARVINDPAALGWEYDPNTGRWTWGGSGSGSGGGGGSVDLSDYVKSTTRNYVNEGSFQLVWDDSSDPTYPFNGRIGYNSQSTDPNSLDGSFLYINGTRGTFSIGRDGDVELHGESEILGVEDRLTGKRPWITGFSYIQAADFLDADGNSIIGSGGGESGPITTSKVLLESPTRLPSGLTNQQDANAYIAESLDKLIDQDGNVIKGGIEEAPDDGNIYGRKNEGWVVVPTGGGGGGDVDLSGYYTAAQCDSKFEPKFIKNTAFNKNFGTSSGTVAQGNHDHSGVYAPVSHTHNYAAVGASYTKAESDARYEPKGGGGGDPFPWTGLIAEFISSNNGSNIKITSGGSRGPEILFANTAGGATSKSLRASGGNLEVVNSAYNNVIFSVSDVGVCTATDFVATSDRNKKDHIETAPTGVIEKLRGVTFQWKDTGKESSGVIAQELQDAGLGHLVHEGDDGLSVAYAGLTAYLIEEIKLLKAEIKALK